MKCKCGNTKSSAQKFCGTRCKAKDSNCMVSHCMWPLNGRTWFCDRHFDKFNDTDGPVFKKYPSFDKNSKDICELFTK